MQTAKKDNGNITALHSGNKTAGTHECMIDFSFDATLRFTSVGDFFCRRLAMLRAK